MFKLNFFVYRFRYSSALDIIEQQILIPYDEEFIVDFFQRSIVILDKIAEDKGMLFRITGPREDISRLKQLAGSKISCA